MSANIVMLVALIAMVAFYFWLFRDGEGPTGRTHQGKVTKSRLLPGAQIRIQSNEPEPAGEQAAEQATGSDPGEEKGR